MSNNYGFMPGLLEVNGKTFPASYENLPGRVVVTATVVENGKESFLTIEIPETDINYMIAYNVADESARLAASAQIEEERPETISNNETMKEEEETMKKETMNATAMSEEEKKQAENARRENALAAIPDEKTRASVLEILSLFSAVYDRLYEQDAKTPANYSKEIDLFDAWMGTPICQEYIGYCCNVRGDLFTSDREIAAFVIACQERNATRKASESSAQIAENERPEIILNNKEEETMKKENAAPEKPARGPAKEKDFAGEALAGNGWSIVFDTGLNRTRVIVAAPLRDTLRPIIESAGFFYSKNQGSWNKKLTHRAHRAAIALADNLRAALA